MHGYKWPIHCTRTRMPAEEVAQLLAAGPPDTCTTTGVYEHCGPACQAPPSRAEVESRRLFTDFSVLTVRDGTLLANVPVLLRQPPQCN